MEAGKSTDPSLYTVGEHRLTILENSGAASKFAIITPQNNGLIDIPLIELSINQSICHVIYTEANRLLLSFMQHNHHSQASRLSS